MPDLEARRRRLENLRIAKYVDEVLTPDFRRQARAGFRHDIQSNIAECDQALATLPLRHPDRVAWSAKKSQHLEELAELDKPAAIDRAGLCDAFEAIPERNQNSLLLAAGINPGNYRSWRNGRFKDDSNTAKKIVDFLARTLRAHGIDTTRFHVPTGPNRRALHHKVVKSTR